ncbi:MAG: KH domain-containing protein [Fusobacterium sp.]|nr:KH domain-containing protein [Fusobacterium sp.]
MEKTIEIKAIDKEKALERASKILDIDLEDKNYEIRLVEKIKPKKKFFGLLGTENGVYEASLVKREIVKEVKKEIKKEVKIEKKQEEKNISKKIKTVETKENVEVKETNKTETKKELAKEKISNKEDEEKVKSEILEVVKNLITKMNLELEIEVKKIKEKNYLVNLVGKDNAIIIGQKGKTLNSFESILNSMLKSYRIEVDVENFKEKRYETLRVLGKRMAEKVIKTNKTVRLNAMPARERKIIHEVVGKYQGLDTFSEGREPKRYIVIKKKR